MGRPCRICGAQLDRLTHLFICGTEDYRKAVREEKMAVMRAAEAAERAAEIRQAEAAAERRRKKNQNKKGKKKKY